MSVTYLWFSEELCSEKLLYRRTELHCCMCGCNMPLSCGSCLVTIQSLPGCTAFFRNQLTFCGLDMIAIASPRLVMMYCCCLTLPISVKSRDAFDKLASINPCRVPCCALTTTSKPCTNATSACHNYRLHNHGGSGVHVHNKMLS